MVHRELLLNGYLLGGECDQGIGKDVVKSPWDGSVVGSVAEAGWAECDAALDAAVASFSTWRHAARHERQALLRRIAQAVRDRSEELAQLAALEIGKPVKLARAEVARTAITFDLAADLLSSYGIESLPVDTDPRGSGHRCLVERFPIGPVLAIVPYNWPYNLAAHKIAPALAAGNTVVVKASSQASLCTLTLGRIIHEAGCPAGVLNVLRCPAALAEKMAKDPRVPVISFTGSPAVGWRLKELLPRKRVSLELGGNCPAIILPDANLDWASERVALGAYGYAGQVCIAVQHALVHRSVAADFESRLVSATQAMSYGDPRGEDVVCGPLISEAEAQRVEEWIDEAVSAGGEVLVGGARKGALVPPTLIRGRTETRLGCQEVFGPVLTLEVVDSLDDAVARTNRSDLGLQAGVFTQNLGEAERAFQSLDVGGVVINDFPSLRFDAMAYGGVKQSGFGREGLRWAFDEMTEPKTLVLRMI